MARKLYWLISDRGEAEPGTRLIRAPYATLAEAQAQFSHDLQMGRSPLRVEYGTEKQQREGEAVVVIDG